MECQFSGITHSTSSDDGEMVALVSETQDNNIDSNAQCCQDVSFVVNGNRQVSIADLQISSSIHKEQTTTANLANSQKSSENDNMDTHMDIDSTNRLPLNIDKSDNIEGAIDLSTYDSISQNIDVMRSNSRIQVASDSEAFQINHMLTELSQTDAHFKSQQRGDPDLTTVEKYEIAYDLFVHNPTSFLTRFGNNLTMDDLCCFAKHRGQYEVDFHIKRIMDNLNKRCSVNVVKNRRYAAMQKLVEEGEYFSEEEMKYRDPLLYEEMIGKFLTDDEVQSRVDKTDLKFSSILLKHIDQLQENKLYYQQKETQECQVEEEDEQEEKSEDEDEESEIETDEEDKPGISDPEKQHLKLEFLQIMQEKFLTGADTEFFDYSKVDENTEFDSLKTIEQDEQDKYFDED